MPAIAMTKVRLASGAGETFGVDDIAVAWAHSGGFWLREGLEVEVLPRRGGVKVVDSVLAGDADVGYGTWVPCVKRCIEGQPIKILASMAQALAQNLVVNKVRVATPADLRGKRWAVDGIGALSHTLALLILKGLGIPDKEVEWVVAGPPPQRIEMLMEGAVDCSLVRVEEAAVLARQHPELLAKLLSFDDILPLAPVQPHGVLSVTQDFARASEEICTKLMRGLVLASRSLHDDSANFRQAVREHVTERPAHIGPAVDVQEEEVQAIWQQEHDAGSFAVNGGVSLALWSRNLQMYAALHEGEGASVTMEDLTLPSLATDVLRQLGAPHPATHDVPDLECSGAVLAITAPLVAQPSKSAADGAAANEQN